MKKGLYIIIVILLIAVLCLGGYLLLNNNKLIISFNTNSELVLESMKVSNGKSIDLPTLERDGYTFLGWYIGDEKIDSNYKFNKDTILSAKWEKIEGLDYALNVYCNNIYGCMDEDGINTKNISTGELIYNKDDFEKINIKTKTSSAKFSFADLNYILYEDGDLKVYDIKGKKTIVNKLNENSNANYLSYASPFVLYKDNGLKIYNVKDNKISKDSINLGVDLNAYALYLNEEGTNTIGIGYIKDGYFGYHNVTKNTNLYENKYKADSSYAYAITNRFMQVNDHVLTVHVSNYPDSDVLLLSSEEEKVLLTEKTNSGSTIFYSYGKNGKYVYIMNYSTQEVHDYFRVYSNNMKPLFEGKGFQTDNNDYKKYVNINDYVYILDGKVVKKFDYDGKLLWTSKEYNEPKGLINRLERSNKFDEYKMASNYIVYVKGDNLVIENIDDDKESSVITKWKKTMRVGLLSYYTKAEANISSKSSQTYEEGIYVSVTEYSEKEMSCDPATVIEYCYTKEKKIISYPSYTTSSCVAAKPLIYLYPEKEMDVEIKLGYSDLLTTSYPKYNGEWKVKAYPSGKLIDKNTGRSLYGLYWEGKNYSAKKTDEGFIVKGSEIAKFLEEKLEILGLTEREAEEFIIYWLPQMEHNKYNYIRFATKEEIDNYMPLEINPKPDTIIRILMEFMPLEEKIDVKEQKLTRVERRGFTAIEWGGSLINQRVVK